MDRSYEIDNFLKYYAQLYYQNPNFEINRKTLYSGLVSYGFSQEEFNNRDIINYFPNWIERYSNKQNLNVFHSDMQKQFLQFQNRKNATDYKCVKLYLSYPKDKIYDCANKIFDFIEQNNFATFSKVSERVRSDAIVLRMDNVEDAVKVMNFINSDLELTQNAKLTNPFLVRNGVVGVAYDDMMSFNEVVSDLMSKYFNQRRSQNTLGLVSIHDFRNYVNYVYSSTFRDVNSLQKFSNSNISDEDIRRCGGMSAAILNCDQIYRMIMMSLDGKTNSNDILNTINDFKNHEKNNSMINYYNSVLESQKYHVKKELDFNDIRAKNVVDNYILHAIDKYGVNGVAKYLEDYKRGNQTAITRDNNYRLFFEKYVSIEQLEKIIGDDTNSYIRQINNIKMGNNFQQNQVNIEQNTLYHAKSILDGYIMHAATKYGVSNVSMYINSFMQNNLDAITRDNGYRQVFSTYMTPNIIMSITGNDIETYIHNIVNEYLSENNLVEQKHI